MLSHNEVFVFIVCDVFVSLESVIIFCLFILRLYVVHNLFVFCLY